MTATFDDHDMCDDMDPELHLDFPVLPPQQSTHHGCSFPFVLQDFKHIIRQPALVALALGFHPVGAPDTSAFSSNCLVVWWRQWPSTRLDDPGPTDIPTQHSIQSIETLSCITPSHPYGCWPKKPKWMVSSRGKFGRLWNGNPSILKITFSLLAFITRLSAKMSLSAARSVLSYRDNTWKRRMHLARVIWGQF